MKLKHILFPSMALLALTACDDFLEVDAPSKYDIDFVFGQKSEMELALNGVYAKAIANNLYGNAYQRTFVLNSDVDMQINSSNSHSHTGFSRFDCDETGGDIKNFWNAAYSLIQVANDFVYNSENSKIYDQTDAELMQWIGEAKCMRAMAYHDLVVMFGDVPFSFTPTEARDEILMPVLDRQAIQDTLIKDLRVAAEFMQSTNSSTVERCSKEFAYGMIARIALTAGGYSLRPDQSNPASYGNMVRPDNYKEYYQLALDYSDKVIKMGTHSLKDDYQTVFVKECNYEVSNNDDPIFELPFARDASGNTGYLQGPTYKAYENETVHNWGACSGDARLNAFYRFQFRTGDLRREFVNGLWYYSYMALADGTLADSTYIRSDYTVHCNKWSKLWTSESLALGKDKSGNTGINYPYMRYADILLMYAEAANEINDGPTAEAVNCLQQVHDRAFPTGDATFYTAAQADKASFLKAVLDERKWEFAGENIRWRDLVRNNLYAEQIVYSFLRYYSAGMQSVGSPIGYEDAITAFDGFDYIDKLPTTIHYHMFYSTDSITSAGMLALRAQFYGYTVSGTGNGRYFSIKYPNQVLPSVRIFNAYGNKTAPAKSQITNYFKLRGAQKDEEYNAGWNHAEFYNWGDEATGTPKAQCKYSFYGYIRGDDMGNIWLIKDGAQMALPASIEADKLPVVRYILPYPNDAIQTSKGAYKNYYGYQKQ